MGYFGLFLGYFCYNFIVFPKIPRFFWKSFKYIN
nr:MAG TPA: Somatostatin/Cortistatin family [Caudoviricetes sp.]